MINHYDEWGTHTSTIVAERFKPNTNHELSEIGNVNIQDLSRQLLESIFRLSVPNNIVISPISDLSILSASNGIATTSWSIKVAGWHDYPNELTERSAAHVFGSHLSTDSFTITLTTELPLFGGGKFSIDQLVKNQL